MKRLAILGLLFFAFLTAQAATVTGPLKTPNGTLLADTYVEFKTRVVTVDDSAIVTPEFVGVTTDDDGDFSISLVPGTYTVETDSSSRARWTVIVPSGSGTYRLDQLSGIAPRFVQVRGDTMTGFLDWTGGTGTVQVASVTTAQRDALLGTNGMIIYNLTSADIEGYKAGNWVSLTSDGGGVGTIEAVVAGDGLTGGGAEGTVSLNVGAGTGIIVNANDIAATLGTTIESAEIVDGTIVNGDINASAAIDATKIGGGGVSTTEFGYIGTLTSDAQTQLDAKRSWQLPVTDGLVLYVHPQSGYNLSGIEVSQWNDASGLGNHLTQSTSTNRPWAVGPGSPVFWTPNDIAATTNKYLSIPSGVAINTTNFSAFAVIHQANSFYTQGLIEWNGSGDGALIAGWANSTNGQRGQLASANTTARVTTNTHSSSLRFVGITAGYDYTSLYDNGLAGIFAANTAADRTGGELGRFDDAYPFMGSIFSVIIYDRVLSADEVEQLKIWAWHTFDARPRGPKQIIFDGDSIITGYGQTDGGSIAQQIATAETDWRTVNFAQPSVHLTNLMTAAATVIDPLFDSNVGNGNNISVQEAGSNDLNGSVTAADLYANRVAYGTARRAAGFKHIEVTLLPRDNNGTFDTKRLAFNALVRAGWPTYADGLADIGADPTIGDQADSLDTRYYLDNVHLTALGSSIAAKYIRAAIRGIENVSIGGTLAVAGTVTSTGGFSGPGTALTGVVQDTDIDTAAELDALNIVNKSATQTITGQKTLSLSPIVPRTDLAGGTALTLMTFYEDALSANRTLTFNTAMTVEGQNVGVKFNVSAAVTLTFPSSKRAGDPDSAITSLFVYPGVHNFTWVYIGGEVVLFDSVGTLNNLAASAAPGTGDDVGDGYSVGSLWIDTTADNSYQCQDASLGAAVWAQIDGAGGGLADPGSNGILARTALDTTVARTIAGTANEISVADGNGVSGNPTISLPSTIDLSGKTVTLPDNVVSQAKIADDAVGLAEMAAGTAGNLITYDASGNPAAVATGTAGQVLTSNGAGAAPTMQTAPSGGYAKQTILTANISPSDSTTYYTGLASAAAATVAAALPLEFPAAGTLRRIRVTQSTGGAGSNEAITAYIRINDTTDYGTITTLDASASVSTVTDSSVSQAVSAGDTFVLKIVTPAWSANPTNVKWVVEVYVQ